MLEMAKQGLMLVGSVDGGLGHFQKDCRATLNPQGGDRDDTALSDAILLLAE